MNLLLLCILNNIMGGINQEFYIFTPILFA